MVVCHGEAKFGRIGVDKFYHNLHVFGRTLVGGNVGYFKPSLFFQVAYEVLKECTPHFFVALRLGRNRCLLEGVALFFVPVQLVVPGKHGVAVDLLFYAKRHHHLYIAVEHGIVKTPSAVFTQGPDNHVFIIVKSLRSPRVAVQRGGDHLLSGFSQRLHLSLDSLEVLIAPHFQVFHACHSRWVLPQVEVIAPLVIGGKCLVNHFQFQRQADLFALGNNLYFRFIHSGLCILGNVDGNPNGTNRLRVHVEHLQGINHIGNKDGLVSWSALATAVGTALVCKGVTYKTSGGYAGIQCGCIALEILYLAHDTVNAFSCPQQDLGRNTFAFPSFKTADFGGTFHWHLAARIQRVCGNPLCFQRANLFPSGNAALRNRNGILGLGISDELGCLGTCRSKSKQCCNVYFVLFHCFSFFKHS